ncbi:hypothetical protein ACA910_020217 [Epithemia clementina (nom. ined.)]
MDDNEEGASVYQATEKVPHIVMPTQYPRLLRASPQTFCAAGLGHLLSTFALCQFQCQLTLCGFCWLNSSTSFGQKEPAQPHQQQLKQDEDASIAASLRFTLLDPDLPPMPELDIQMARSCSMILSDAIACMVSYWLRSILSILFVGML